MVATSFRSERLRLSAGGLLLAAACHPASTISTSESKDDTAPQESARARWSQLEVSPSATLPEDVTWIVSADGDGTPPASRALASVFDLSWSSGHLLGDFDGDGACELLIAEGPALRRRVVEPHSLGRFLPAATPTVTRPPSLHGRFGSDPELVRSALSSAARMVSADLNADGIFDLILAQPGFDRFGEPAFGGRGRVHLWTGSEAGYGPARTLEGPVSLGSALVGPLDFDGDGHLDVAVSAPEQGRVFVMRGASSEATWTTLEAGLASKLLLELETAGLGDLPGWTMAALKDRDGDGSDELLVSGSQGAHLYLGRPAPALAILAEPGEGVFGVGGDFDGDGRGDLALGEARLGRVSILFGKIPLPTSPLELALPRADLPQFSVEGGLWGLGPTQDLDGDQRADLWVVGFEAMLLIYGPELSSPEQLTRVGETADAGRTGFRLNASRPTTLGEGVLSCDLTGDGLFEHAVSVSTDDQWVSHRLETLLFLGGLRP